MPSERNPPLILVSSNPDAADCFAVMPKSLLAKSLSCNTATRLISEPEPSNLSPKRWPTPKRPRFPFSPVTTRPTNQLRQSAAKARRACRTNSKPSSPSPSPSKRPLSESLSSRPSSNPTRASSNQVSARKPRQPNASPAQKKILSPLRHCNAPAGSISKPNSSEPSYAVSYSIPRPSPKPHPSLPLVKSSTEGKGTNAVLSSCASAV